MRLRLQLQQGKLCIALPRRLRNTRLLFSTQLTWKGDAVGVNRSYQWRLCDRRRSGPCPGCCVRSVLFVCRDERCGWWLVSLDRLYGGGRFVSFTFATAIDGILFSFIYGAPANAIHWDIIDAIGGEKIIVIQDGRCGKGWATVARRWIRWARHGCGPFLSCYWPVQSVER
jgi:hypothetical protein